jgi:hypothetical protein
MRSEVRDMVEVGDEVVIMSAPGRFRVIAIEGPVLTIENDGGVRKQVHEVNIRTLDKRPVD